MGGSSRTLTRRQQAVLDFVRRYEAQHGYGPSYREIHEALGLSSTSVAYYNIMRLEVLGYLQRNPSAARCSLLPAREAPEGGEVPREGRMVGEERRKGRMRGRQAGIPRPRLQELYRIYTDRYDSNSLSRTPRPKPIPVARLLTVEETQWLIAHALEEEPGD